MAAHAVTEEHFPVMGSAGHLVVVGGPADLARRGVEQLERLEALWSRFRPTSEISRLNQAGGAPCLVSGPTRLLVEALVSAWELTGGRFDPTVGGALSRLGYDHSWPLLSPPIRLPRAHASVGCTGVSIDLDQGLIQLARDLTLDPGGLGKGLAADIVATDLVAAGAAGVLVNVGGDLRVIGTAPDGDEWLIAVEHPDHPDDPRHHLTRLALTGGGVATSTAARRRWSTGDGTPVHHLIDPATSLPATTTRRQVTVVAGCAWWAEALAKVAFLDGSLPDVQAGALIVERDGSTSSVGRLDRFARQEETVA
ncbi:MAG: FAD:protein FMN transferase [Acidimicrobiales bacterium]